MKFKATRKSGMGREYFVAYVKLTSETRGDKPSPSMTQQRSVPKHSKSLDYLLQKYQVVFQELPKELPPFKEDIGHAIPLQPGAIPPYRAPYRQSPLEQAEVKKHIWSYWSINALGPAGPHTGPRSYLC